MIDPSIEQLAQYAGPLLAYAWPLLQQTGVKLGEKVAGKAADKGADKVFEYGKQLWDKLRGKPEAKALEESAEQADGKPSVPALTAPLQQLLAADPQLTKEIATLLDQAWQHESVQNLWVNNGLSISNSPGATIVGRDQYQAPVIKAEAGSTVIVEASPGEGTTAAPTPVRTQPAPARIVPQLRDPVADFTGRARQAKQLVARLRKREGAVITAIGGQGKTELAYYVAREVSSLYPGGQVQVDLRGLEAKPVTPEAAMAHVIVSLERDLKLPDEPEQVAGLYQGLLADRAVLVLADNAKDSEQVRPLVPKSPSALLVTSRQTVQLDGIKSVDLSELARSDSKRLLRRILDGKPARDGEIAKLAKLCGDLPLALRVAGNRLAASPALSVVEYLKRLEEKRSELRFQGRDVMAVLAESVEALERDAPELAGRWRSLAVFPAPFDRAAAEAVGEFEDGELDALLGRSLVLYEVKDGRFRLHDLMRDLAREGWGHEGAYNVAKRHAQHYLKVTGEAGSTYLRDAEGVLEGLRLFDRERAHIEAGQAWATEHALSDDQAATLAQDYPVLAPNVLDLRQHPREKIRWLEASVKAARKLGNKACEGTALGNLGIAYADLGKTRRAIEYFEQDLAIKRETGDRQGEGRPLGNLGAAYAALGETRRAIEYYEQDLAIARETGDRRGKGATLGNLGLAYAALGETRQAIEYYEQVLAIAGETGDRRGEEMMLGNLGLAYADLGETRRAIEYYEQGLAIVRETGDHRGEGKTLGNLGIAYSHLGEVRRAIEYYEQGLAITRETGDRRGEGNALGNLGTAYTDLGETRRPIEYFEQHLAIAREAGDRLGEGNALGNLGKAYLILGETRRAIEYCEQYLTIARETGDRRGEGTALFNMSLGLDKLGERAKAIEHAREALAIYEQIEDPNAAKVRRQLAAWGEEPGAGNQGPDC